MLHDTTPTASFTDPASAPQLERVAEALRANGFAAEILDDAAAARVRVKDLIPEGSSVLTGASETLRLSGIDDDLNAGRPVRRHQAPHPDHRPRDGR